MMKMRLIRKHTGTIVILTLTIVTIILGTSINTFARDRTLTGKTPSPIELENREMEKLFRQNLRDLLCRAGFSGSGINMTRTVHLLEQSDGTTDGTVILNYTVTIHHRRISELSMDELTGLLTDITAIGLPVEGSMISYRFL